MLRQGAAAALLLTAGCGAPAPPPAPPVTLSTTDTAANVGALSTFFRQVCLDAAPDVPRMTAVVAASGWPVLEMYSETRLDPQYWRFDHGDLLWIPRPETRCSLGLDSLVSPTPAALGAALRPAVQRSGFEMSAEDANRIVWTRPAGGDRRMVLMIEVIPPDRGRTRGEGRQAVSLSLSSETIPAARPQGE
jgi:hypothetical protein